MSGLDLHNGQQWCNTGQIYQSDSSDGINVTVLYILSNCPPLVGFHRALVFGWHQPVWVKSKCCFPVYKNKTNLSTASNKITSIIFILHASFSLSVVSLLFFLKNIFLLLNCDLEKLSCFKPYSGLAVIHFVTDSTGGGNTPVASQEATQAWTPVAGRRWRWERRVSSEDTAGWNLLKCHRKSIFHSRCWSWLDFGLRPINNECMAYLTRHSPGGWGRRWSDRLVTRNTLLPLSVRPQVGCCFKRQWAPNLPFLPAPDREESGPQPRLCRFSLYESFISLESSVDRRIPSAVRNLISVLCLSSRHPGDLSPKPIPLKCQTARLHFELHGDNRLSHSWVVTFCEETWRLNWGSPAQPFNVSQHRCSIWFWPTYFIFTTSWFFLLCAARHVTSGLIMNTASIYGVMSLRGGWENRS